MTGRKVGREPLRVTCLCQLIDWSLVGAVDRSTSRSAGLSTFRPASQQANETNETSGRTSRRTTIGLVLLVSQLACKCENSPQLQTLDSRVQWPTGRPTDARISRHVARGVSRGISAHGRPILPSEQPTHDVSDWHFAVAAIGPLDQRNLTTFAYRSLAISAREKCSDLANTARVCRQSDSPGAESN